MIKVIDGKKFNTETATEVAKYWNGYGKGDFEYIEEVLYMTSKGTYFVHGCGGAKSNYRTIHGNTQSSGEDLIPLTQEEALQWCEKTNNSEAAVAHFEVEEA